MKQIFNGVVRREVVAQGSKSEHTALVLDTGSTKMTLRLRGTNAFEEPAALTPFVDQRVRVQGVTSGSTLFVGNIQVKR